MDSERVTPLRSFDVAEAKKHLIDFVKVDHDRNEILEVSPPEDPNL
jgi:hypothetical protein